MSEEKSGEKVVYTKSAAQLDAEARKNQKAEEMATARPKTENPDYNAKLADTSFAVEGNDTSAYRGVSPEYATYPDETSRPISGGWSDSATPEARTDNGDQEGNEPSADSDSKPSGGAVGAATEAKSKPAAGSLGPAVPKLAGK